MTSTVYPEDLKTRCVAFIAALLLVGATATSQASDSVSIDAQGKQPRVSVSADGTVHVLYGVGQMMKVRSSHDGGASFDAAIDVGKIDQLMLGMRRGPQLASGDGVLVAAGIGAVGDILSWCSNDNGKSWVGPVTINDKPKAAREGLFSLSAGAKATAWATWLDLRDGKAQIYASRTTDGGKKWTSNASIYRSPDGTVCECCQPQVAADAGGNVVFMWRNFVSGARDMYSCSSPDGGRTFTKPAKLGSGTWPLNACPMDGGGIAIAGQVIETIWRRDGKTFATTASDQSREIELAAGKNGAVAISGKSVLRVWQSGEVIVLNRGDEAVTDIGNGSFPTIAAISGKDGAAVVAWEAVDGIRVLAIP